MKIILFLISVFLVLPSEKAFAACPPDKPLALFNLCFPCDDPKAVLVSTELKYNDFTGRLEEITPAQRCPNRKIVQHGRIRESVLKQCPPEKPFRDASEGCFGCDDKENVTVKAGDTSCPNRVLRRADAPSERLSALACPADKPLTSRCGNEPCYSCDDEMPVCVHDFDEQEMNAACPNRKIIEHYSMKYSILAQYDGLTNDKEFYRCDSDARDIYIASDKSKTHWGGVSYQNPCKNRYVLIQGPNVILRLTEDISTALAQNNGPISIELPERKNPYMSNKQYVKKQVQKMAHDARIQKANERHKQEEFVCTQKDYDTGFCSLCSLDMFPQANGVFVNQPDAEYVCTPCGVSQEIFLPSEQAAKTMKNLCGYRLTYQYGTYGQYSVPDTPQWKRKYISCVWGLFCQPENKTTEKGNNAIH